MADIAGKAADLAGQASAEPPKKRGGLAGLLVLDPMAPGGIADERMLQNEYLWNNPDELRRRLNPGENL